MRLLNFIHDAVRALPEEYELVIVFRKDGMEVEVHNPAGEPIEVGYSMPEKCGDVGYCQHAINAARADAGLAPYYHESLIDTSVLNWPTEPEKRNP